MKAIIKHKRAISFLILLFIASRIIFYLMGVRFNFIFWQDDRLLSAEMLQNHFWESLFYLHTQPPAYNFFIGFWVNILPDSYHTAIAISYKVAGLVLIVSLYLLMRKVQIRPVIALTLVSIFCLSPASILFENFLVYTYPLCAWLSVSALLLHIFLEKKSVKWGYIFFTSLVIISLTRSLFHLVWFAVIIVGIIGFQRKNRAFTKKVFKASFLPFFFVFFFYFKNWLLYDTFTVYSWFPMQAMKGVSVVMPTEEKRQLVAENKASELLLVTPYSRPVDQYYYKWLNTKQEKIYSNIVVLQDSSLYTDIRLFTIQKLYLQEFIKILKYRPKTYLKTVLVSTAHYFYPSSAFIVDKNNIAQYTLYFENLMLGKFIKPYSFYIIILHFFVGLSILKILFLDKVYIKKFPKATLGVFAYLLFTLIFAFTAENLFNIFENMRGRFLTLPCSLVILGGVIEYWLQILKHKKENISS